jgi:hypothetical protein
VDAAIRANIGSQNAGSKHLYALLALLIHVAIGSLAAMAIAPYSLDPAATSRSLWTLGIVSALLSTTGLAATAMYLCKRIKPVTGAQAGLLCGLMCGGLLALTMGGMRYSLVLYLTMLAPTLVAVLLASLLERSKGGWQP